jgi:endonuclease I
LEQVQLCYFGPIFEPINEFKGDIARMYFYFGKHVMNTVAGYSYAMFNGTSNQVFTTAFFKLVDYMAQIKTL